MFSNVAIGFFAGIGFGGWVYSKLARSTGGNTQNSLIGAALSGIVAWVLVTAILGFAFHT